MMDPKDCPEPVPNVTTKPPPRLAISMASRWWRCSCRSWPGHDSWTRFKIPRHSSCSTSSNSAVMDPPVIKLGMSSINGDGQTYPWP